MKTAMQELTDILENCKMSDITDEQKSIFSSIIYQIDIIFLRKEKEQIINAYEDGKENQRDSITNIYNYIIGEFYYNQTYNQNQHIIDIMKADEDDGLYKMFDTDSDKKH
jgi:hypothetical protein